MIHLIGLPTIRRYERAWQLFWSFTTIYEPSLADLGCHAPDLTPLETGFGFETLFPGILPKPSQKCVQRSHAFPVLSAVEV